MKKRTIFIIIISVISLILCGLIINHFVSNKQKDKTPQQVVIESKIEKYGYELKDKDTEYYKELFKKLNTELTKETLNEEEYAKLLAEMFITDFYTLDNKLTNSDIGGVGFVYSDYISTFSSKAQNTIYKTVKSNIYGDRKQTLPIVTKVQVNSIETTSFKYNDKTDKKAYTIKVSITYKEDLGYPTIAQLVLIHNEFKLEVAKMN